jgi:ceramide glucosyltransferase
LRSWLRQDYRGPMRVLFGVADSNDPVCEKLKQLGQEFPDAKLDLIITGEPTGSNPKVSNLHGLYMSARCIAWEPIQPKDSPIAAGSPNWEPTEVYVISDADVRVPEDFLTNAVAPLQKTEVGLVNCFYELANPTTLAMKWEAIAVNADFWSQVLQSNSLKPQDFALGAVMVTRREQLQKIGGFEPLLEYLADDYQLGHRIAATGARIEMSPVVVECRDKPMTFRDVWNHQLRWARTIRASQPAPYFFSILNNVTLWALLLIAFGVATHVPVLGLTEKGSLYLPIWRDPVTANSSYSVETGYSATLLLGLAAILLRMIVGSALATRLTRKKSYYDLCWLVPVKDLLQVGIWLGAFLGNTIEWGGKKFRLEHGGRLRSLQQQGDEVYTDQAK